MPPSCFYIVSLLFVHCFYIVCAMFLYCFFTVFTLSHEMVMQVSHGACASFADRLSSGRTEPGTKKACVTATAQLVP